MYDNLSKDIGKLVIFATVAIIVIVALVILLYIKW